MKDAMHSYPVPSNERSRERLLDEMDLNDRAGDPFFDDIVAIAAEIFEAPIAFISLISGETQCFLQINGLDETETPRTHSMCAYTVAERKTIVSGDTHDDPRFRNHPIVANPPHVRFSASAPIILSSGFCTGTICAVDVVPHPQPSEDQIAHLERLARMAARFFEAPLEPDPEQARRLAKISEDAQDEFLTLISHELRTPLNGILSIAKLMSPQSPDEQELVEVLTGSAEHLNAIVENVMNFTELASGDIQLDERPFEPLPMLASILTGQRRIAQALGKSLLDLEIPDANLVIKGDPAKLELALVCLFSNFIAHGGSEARVDLGQEPSGDLFILINDNGNGIDPLQEARIWQPFAVGQKVKTRVSDGMGLGLPLTRRIIELHGGALDLFSDENGLKARITLPAWRIEPPKS